MESRYKVFVLQDIDQANLPATNALLKTLEEPPGYVVLLLTTSRPHRLLPTVISRCQVIPLRPLSQGQIIDALVTHWHAEPEQARLLARLSEGRLGWAVERLTDREVWEGRSQRLAEIGELAASHAVERLAYAEALSRRPVAVQPTLILWASWWRDLMLVQQDCSEYISNVDRQSELETHASLYDSLQVRRFLQRLHLAPTQLSQNINVRLLLENLVLHMPTPVPAT
jgi:DNA polymerase-3 subunit delta'